MRDRGHADEVVVGLDIGTTKIVIVVGEMVKGNVKFRGMHSHPSAGMRKGIVVNMEEMTRSIRDALQEAGASLGVEINSVYASISGSHIRGCRNAGTAGVGGREITYADIDRAIGAAQSVYLPLDRELLHVMPSGHTIDGQSGIKNPVGMTGESLEANVYAITGAAAPIQNLLKCCEKAGVEVADLVFGPVALAGSMLSDDERELGVALIDIGGGTTDILLYKDGWPIHASVLAIGGNHFTNDLAVGLKIPVSEAERIKKQYGTVSAQTVSDSEQIRIVHAGQERTIARRYVAEILQARTDEFLDLIQREFPSGLGYETSLTGVVLTGGGSLLNGMAKTAEQIWGVPVRAGNPIDIHGTQGFENSSDCVVGAGLVRYACEASLEGLYPEVAVVGIMGKIRNWAREIFKIYKGGIEYVRN